MPYTACRILAVLRAWCGTPMDHQARATTAPCRSSGRRGWVGVLLVVLLVAWGAGVQADDVPPALFLWPPFFETPAPSWWPQFLGAQVTVIPQHLFPFHSPYVGPNSLVATGDTQVTHTYGVYFGAQIVQNLQGYVDVEMARGGAVGAAVGLGDLTNGDVIRQGSVELGKGPYVARAFVRYVVPLAAARERIERDMDQVPGAEPVRRLEVKAGILALTDDFDHNRYANNTRTQFMNWSFIFNTAWDFAADTRGYTRGLMLGWITPTWAVRLGSYQMPTFANGNILDNDVLRARGDNLELTLQPPDWGTVFRLLAYANHARMGRYNTVVAQTQATGTTPDIAADDRPGRVKYGVALNIEQPLADGGESTANALRSSSFGNSISNSRWQMGGRPASSCAWGGTMGIPRALPTRKSIIWSVSGCRSAGCTGGVRRTGWAWRLRVQDWRTRMPAISRLGAKALCLTTAG